MLFYTVKESLTDKLNFEKESEESKGRNYESI